MIINNYFHDNNSTTTASLVKEKMLRAVVDCVICTRKAYCLRCSTLLVALGKLIVYGVELCYLRLKSLLSMVQHFAGYVRKACFLRCSILLKTF